MFYFKNLIKSKKHLFKKSDTFLPGLYNVNLIFMQDNAPCHKTLNVMNYLASKNVETLKWPSQSPDLNPIETLWALIKQKKQSKYGMLKTKQEFVEQIFEIWDHTLMSEIENLTNSIENRLISVLRKKGRQTKY